MCSYIKYKNIKECNIKYYIKEDVILKGKLFLEYLGLGVNVQYVFRTAKNTKIENIFAIKSLHLKKKKKIQNLRKGVESVLLLLPEYPYFYLSTEHEYFCHLWPVLVSVMDVGSDASHQR